MIKRITHVLGGIPRGLLPGTVLVMIAIALFGYSAVDVSWIQDSRNMGGNALYGIDFVQILARNVGAALFLFSGVVTLGATTLIGSAVLALYVGATVSLGTHSVGQGQLLTDVIWYVPFEFLGLILAATAGLQPVAGMAAGFIRHSPVSLSTFVINVARSLGTMALALLLIVVGAAIEAIVIQLRI
ncbi:hypothetical protein [Paenarthrobacter nicotinovorans]|uniref:hypothetical protein n=1 Tax=Paenarthrobacter nicotinovorans TaxID=29320 RepID=UPI0011A67D2E|nr:hypothetical protein [Paenarthrobacter nicotinovorans]